jgi:hypothetical protein
MRQVGISPGSHDAAATAGGFHLLRTAQMKEEACH